MVYNGILATAAAQRIFAPFEVKNWYHISILYFGDKTHG